MELPKRSGFHQIQGRVLRTHGFTEQVGQRHPGIGRHSEAEDGIPEDFDLVTAREPQSADGEELLADGDTDLRRVCGWRR